MKFAKAGWAVAAAVLFVSVGCDYWNNLVDEKTLTRADLEVRVVDAWTGEALGDADCRDSLQGITLAPDGNGGFRIAGGSTGDHEIHCEHVWYYPGTAKIHLTKAGAIDTVKLARRGEPGNWYPDAFRLVRIPRTDTLIRFPTDLDWQVTPFDTTRRFRYEWSFRVAKALSHGHLNGSEQLDSQSFSPRFRARASAETVPREGRDTVILTVFSLMNGGQAGYSVGSDTLYFNWVRNLKPFIRFQPPFDSIPPSFKVGCGNEAAIARVLFRAGDSDGTCASIRFWTQNAPSVGKLDSIRSCDDLKTPIKLPLFRPTRPGVTRPDGSEEYDNTLYAEITDDNGEKGRDSVTFITYTNSPPDAQLSILGGGGGTYFINDPVTFRVKAKDTDGGIQQMDIEWKGASESDTTDYPWRASNFPLDSVGEYSITNLFQKADQFRAVGSVIDNCGDVETSEPLSFTVKKDIPPEIQYTHPDTLITENGDSLKVHFALSVTDADAAIVGNDDIKSVRIAWDASTVETDTARAQSIQGKSFQHSYPMPRPGTSLSILIQVEDEHGGVADTVIRIP